ncbi:MAG: hypothetical protein JWP87_5392 [Labilithrix sp.]|jgi:hypothetical protein|nr:hypothetical protein [Labilithrix sp.]
MDSRPKFAAAWYAQRVAASAAVSAVEDAELRALTDAEALRRSEALLSLAASTPNQREIPEYRRTTSGLVEQQALFARTRR